MDGLMRGLAAAGHEVSILSFITTDQWTQETLEATRLFCKKVTTLPDLDARVLRDKRRLQMRSLLSMNSYEHLQVKSRRDFQEQIDAHLASESYDVVQVEFANMASYHYARRSKNQILVLDEHNIEYDLQRRTAGSAEGAFRKVYNSVNWRKLGREERAAWRRFDGVVLTSVRDAQLLKTTAPNTRTAVVPNGVDVEQFKPAPLAPLEDQLLFFGANNYFPNHDALLYFIDEILPKVVAQRPNAKLSIVGPGVHASILARQSRHVEVVGFVDDVTPYLDRASAVVVPLRIGGGTRLKIVEAMAKSKAIISTRIGAEGIDVTHDRDVLLGDTPGEFAAQVVRALSDRALAQRLGEQARKLAEQRYAWTAVVSQLVRFYGQLQR
jgi:glycosyltransferase involved in cell wall biosynthesis